MTSNEWQRKLHEQKKADWLVSTKKELSQKGAREAIVAVVFPGLLIVIGWAVLLWTR